MPTSVRAKSDLKNYGAEGGLLKEKGGGLFGYTDLYGGYSGGQAEYVRVPYANFGPRKVRSEKLRSRRRTTKGKGWRTIRLYRSLRRILGRTGRIRSCALCQLRSAQSQI